MIGFCCEWTVDSFNKETFVLLVVDKGVEDNAEVEVTEESEEVMLAVVRIWWPVDVCTSCRTPPGDESFIHFKNKWSFL